MPSVVDRRSFAGTGLRNLPRPRRRLIVASMALLLLTTLGAVVAVTQHLPEGAAHPVPGSDVWAGFLRGGGTAMSAPFPAWCCS